MQAISNLDAAFGNNSAKNRSLQDLCFHYKDYFFAPVITDYSPLFKHRYTDIIKVVKA